MPITVVDVQYDDGIGWAPLRAHRAAGKQLIRGFRRQVDDLITPAGRFVLKKTIGALHTALGSAFGDELDSLAEALDAEGDEILTANLAYDLSQAGCSTFVQASRGDPLHARNLDWPFPRRLLRRHTLVVRVHDAPGGSYSMVTWPGFFGGLTAIAPGRFSVTVNHVAHSDESGVLGILRRGWLPVWPAPWAVRHALELCEDYTAAVRYLSKVRLLSPVLFTVAGIRVGQAVVIERGVADYALRRPVRGAVSVTNHYRSPEYEDCNPDLSKSDTEERGDCLGRLLQGRDVITPELALRLLSRARVLRDDTQQQVVMVPRTGDLRVRLPGRRPVSTRSP